MVNTNNTPFADMMTDLVNMDGVSIQREDDGVYRVISQGLSALIFTLEEEGQKVFFGAVVTDKATGLQYSDMGPTWIVDAFGRA